MLILRLKYKPEPILWIGEDDVREGALDLLSGAILSKKRYCVGHWSSINNYVLCGRVIKDGFQCEECRRRDVWNPCAVCTGAFCVNPNEEVRNFCMHNNFIVYLAYFGGHKIKVGVTFEGRLEERLLEQGAVAYTIHSHQPNGLRAREVETKMKKVFVDRLTTVEKVKLYKRVDIDWFEEVVGSATILEQNLEVVEGINPGAKLLFGVRKLPKGDVKAVGQLLVFKDALVPFSEVKGRKIIG